MKDLQAGDWVMSRIVVGGEMRLAQVDKVDLGTGATMWIRVRFVGGIESFFRSATEVIPVDPMIVALRLAQEKPC